MEYRNKNLIKVCLGIFLIILLADCAPKRPIILDIVFSQPGIDFKIYKKIAILEFTPNPKVKKKMKFCDVVGDEFRIKGYDVVTRHEFDSVLQEFGFSIEDLSDIEVLNKVSERLKISAIIKGYINRYEVREKEDYMPVIIENVGTTIVEKKYICDISFNIEMIEANDGNKIWSCSIYCDNKKGKPEKLIRKMIKNCLDTIPQEY